MTDYIKSQTNRNELGQDDNLNFFLCLHVFAISLLEFNVLPINKMYCFSFKHRIQRPLRGVYDGAFVNISHSMLKAVLLFLSPRYGH